MHEEELRYLMRNCKELDYCFKTVTCPSKLISLKIEYYPTLIITNVSECLEKGSHWISFFINKSSEKIEIEYFDSFAKNLSYYSETFNIFLSKYCNTYKQSEKPIQHFSSNNCGLFCLGFLYMRSKQIPMETFLELFSLKNKSKNDEIIENIVQKYYSME
jgi:hypothetical protein